MILFELIGEFILEVIFIEILGGIFSGINNSILKLRGIEPRSIDEIKLDKIRKRYESRTVKLKRNIGDIKKGTHGVVVKVIGLKSCLGMKEK